MKKQNQNIVPCSFRRSHQAFGSWSIQGDIKGFKNKDGSSW